MNWQDYARAHPTMGVWYERYRRSARLTASRPGWVMRGALLAGALVVVVPLVLVTVAAVLVGAAVFVALSLVAHVVSLFSGRGGAARTGGDDGRRNVRVMER